VGGYNKTSKSISVYTTKKEEKKRQAINDKFHHEATGTPTKPVAGTIGFQNRGGAGLFEGTTDPP
jgi:hypothetical protein